MIPDTDDADGLPCDDDTAVMAETPIVLISTRSGMIITLASSSESVIFKDDERKQCRIVRIEERSEIRLHSVI